MIKFFKKIRRKTLTESKFGKYMLYAIGEIILVVIGILIALQINNWNEARKLNKQESLYIERLLLENQQDLLTFAKSIEDLKKGNQTIKDLSNALNNSGIKDSMLLEVAKDYLIYGCHYPFFNPSTSTFEDLSSTGNLGVIKDTKLRDLIVSHYANYKHAEANFKVNTDWALPIDAPLYVESDILKFEPTVAFLFESTSNKTKADEFRENKEKCIRNAAVHYWVNEYCILLLSDVKDETASLVSQLENELKKQ